MKELIVLKKPKSSTSEAIRTLRTNLHFTFVDKGVNIIMVTSSMPGEGKSFISANLAAAFSMVNSKVLLIDCDLRKGRQHQIFNLNNERGLSNLLIDDINNYSKYIQKTRIRNLSILPAGVVPPNPSELLGSKKNKYLIEKLKQEYNLIIFDCPPLNCVTDSLILTSLATQAIIVSAYKKTPIDLLATSKKSIESTGIKISGVVFNQMEPKGKNHYYNKYYQ